MVRDTRTGWDYINHIIQIRDLKRKRFGTREKGIGVTKELCSMLAVEKVVWSCIYFRKGVEPREYLSIPESVWISGSLGADTGSLSVGFTRVKPSKDLLLPPTSFACPPSSFPTSFPSLSRPHSLQIPESGSVSTWRRFYFYITRRSAMIYHGV